MLRVTVSSSDLACFSISTTTTTTTSSGCPSGASSNLYALFSFLSEEKEDGGEEMAVLEDSDCVSSYLEI